MKEKKMIIYCNVVMGSCDNGYYNLM